MAAEGCVCPHLRSRKIWAHGPRRRTTRHRRCRRGPKRARSGEGTLGLSWASLIGEKRHGCCPNAKMPHQWHLEHFPTHAAAARYGIHEDYGGPDSRPVVKPARLQLLRDAPRSWPSTRLRIASVQQPRRYSCPRYPYLPYARQRLRRERLLSIYEIPLSGQI